ncbi:hypothetical protein Y032_0006g3138 [Ancylostoma ceylanicum]|uniref:Uncharacterized protein n=1 Tax=Ancylostoma ceylanicum TaxID=53326 RepID=A0A016VSG7_9BILA|nr:hypothetical protein Y032_0006g3138 [Ancylostoma ceylanicum]
MEPPHQPTTATKQHFYSQPTHGRVRPTLRLPSRFRQFDARRRNGPANATSSTLLTPTPSTRPTQRQPGKEDVFIT